MFFYSDFKFMPDAEGTTEMITSVACLNIWKNYLKHMLGKKNVMQETRRISKMLS